MKDKLEAIDFFIDNIVFDIENISTNITKANLQAYISAWKTSLMTVKSIINE